MSEKSQHEIRQIAELAGHDERVWSIAWNPVRPLIASCSSDKTIRLYHYANVPSASLDAPDLSFNLSSSIPTGHTKTVRSVAWAPSGKTLAAGSFDANISVWEQEGGSEDGGDVEEEDDDVDEADPSKKDRTGGGNTKGEWECMALLEGHETECKCVAYSSSGTLLASCSRDKTVWVWEVQPDSDFECMGVLMTHSQDVKHVSWHPTEELLASASYDDTIKLYADDPRLTDDWDVVATLTGHTSTVWATTFSPCGRFMASCSADQSVRIWKRGGNGGGGVMAGNGGGNDLYSWECAVVLKDHERSVYSVSWGKGKENEDSDAGQRMDVDGDVKAVSGVGMSAGWLASTGGDGRVNVWDVRTSREGTVQASILATFPEAHGVHDVNHIAWCPRKGYEDVFATAGDDLLVRVWRIVSMGEVGN